MREVDPHPPCVAEAPERSARMKSSLLSELRGETEAEAEGGAQELGGLCSGVPAPTGGTEFAP